MGWMLMWRPSQHSYNKEVQGSFKTSKPTRPSSHAREPKVHQHQPKPRRERYLEPGRKLQMDNDEGRSHDEWRTVGDIV